VFFKGCPLRCAWCHNPEGLRPEPELMIKKNLCTGCGKCMRGCAHEQCKPFDRCTKVCPNGCIEVCGERVDAAELAKKLKRNATFFEGGGVTLSGGEPLAQPAFVLDLLRELRPLHRAFETSGYAPEDAFAAVASEVDLVLMDLKLMDQEAHKKYIGAPNDLILRNLELLKQTGKPFIIRIPLIPGINDREANMEATAQALADAADRVKVEVLPYNQLFGAKYDSVGRQYEPPFDPKAVVPCPTEPFERHDIPVAVF